MRRPPLTRLRTEGLGFLLGLGRPRLDAKPGDVLFAPPRSQRRALRAAARYIDEVRAWQDQRGSGAPKP